MCYLSSYKQKYLGLPGVPLSPKSDNKFFLDAIEIQNGAIYIYKNYNQYLRKQLWYDIFGKIKLWLSFWY
jgi:hypothetical protein